MLANAGCSGRLMVGEGRELAGERPGSVAQAIWGSDNSRALKQGGGFCTGAASVPLHSESTYLQWYTGQSFE